MKSPSQITRRSFLKNTTAIGTMSLSTPVVLGAKSPNEKIQVGCIGIGVRGGGVEIPERHRDYFGLIEQNPDIFSGFFHIDLEGNVLPKLQLLRQFGFYPEPDKANAESCGAHSPKVKAHELATRAS